MSVKTKSKQKIDFIANQEFDSKRMRHYVNGELSVLHCHHYSTLFTQLADDAKLLQGEQLLRESSEEVFYPVFSSYFKKNKIQSTEDRISVVEQHCSFIGMGELNLQGDGDSWIADMKHSHVDEGWIKKWSNRDKPVNFIGQGYLAAAVEAITNSAPGTYQATETRSMVSGAKSSKFEIKKN